MEKILVKNGENGEIYCTMLAGTEPQPRGFSSGTQGTCITLLVPLRNVISERRRLQNKNGEKSGENGENYSYDTWSIARSWGHAKSAARSPRRMESQPA